VGVVKSIRWTREQKRVLNYIACQEGVPLHQVPDRHPSRSARFNTQILAFRLALALREESR